MQSLIELPPPPGALGADWLGLGLSLVPGVGASDPDPGLLAALLPEDAMGACTCGDNGATGAVWGAGAASAGAAGAGAAGAVEGAGGGAAVAAEGLARDCAAASRCIGPRAMTTTVAATQLPTILPIARSSRCQPTRS